MNKVSKDETILISTFLETHEFMLFLRSSNIIYKSLSHLISWRKPYFILCNPCYNYSSEFNDLLDKIIKDNPEVNYASAEPEIRALLILGKSKSTTGIFKPNIVAVPYIFRNHINLIGKCKYDTDLINYTLLIYDKLTKYQNKINNSDNIDDIDKAKIFYFNKLLIFKSKLDDYIKYDNIYFNIYNERLEKLLNK